MYLCKRPFDLLFSILILILLSPVLIVISAVLFFQIGRPIFFVHERPGLKGKVFKLIKFRTMSNERGSDGELLPDAQRITGFGQFLRKTSLDELPELVNVVLGSMSIVGPRPLLIQYLPLYSTEQARRHDVRPGITGLAQTNGRNSISWDEKFSFDIYYVDNCSLWMDVKIIARTVSTVFTGSDINQGSMAVGAEPFMGNATDTNKHSGTPG